MQSVSAWVFLVELTPVSSFRIPNSLSRELLLLFINGLSFCSSIALILKGKLFDKLSVMTLKHFFKPCNYSCNLRSNDHYIKTAESSVRSTAPLNPWVFAFACYAWFWILLLSSTVINFVCFCHRALFNVDFITHWILWKSQILGVCGGLTLVDTKTNSPFGDSHRGRLSRQTHWFWPAVFLTWAFYSSYFDLL